MEKRDIAAVCESLGRRQVLRSFAGALGGAALSACGGGGDTESNTSTVAQDEVTPVPARSAKAEGAAAALPSPPVIPGNELRVSLPRASFSNYPLQFGRAFAQGVITGEPFVALDGNLLPAQQVDIKTRYGDGSVKFAVISVLIPEVTTQEIVLAIGNRAAEPARSPELVRSMLSSKYDFDATIGIAVGGQQVAGAPVSARAMLSSLTDAALAAETAAGGVNSRFWTVGPVCTTVLLCDHTTKVWDVGTNATKAIRPMFHVQFWPGIGRYHVRHIIEVADVTKLKDETGIDVTFTTGHSRPETRLSQVGAYVYAATFQTRAYWGGGDVPRANVKHGVAYLASTGAMPNYDPRIVMNAAAIDSYKTDWWMSKSKVLGAPGYWQKAMATTGGRPDLGLLPKWEVVALYSGSADMHAISEAQAEMAGSWAFFFREGDASRVVHGSVGGVGRVISKISRPQQFMYDGNGNMVTRGTSGFTVDGVLSTARNGWQHDHAHTPGVFWFSYLTTGAAFWHEKLAQLGAWSQFLTNPGLSYNSVGNGRTSTDLVLNGVQSRGWGWQYRNRARAWWAALDGSGEKALFAKSLEDAAAQRAGLYDVSGMMVGNPIRDAWNTNHLTWYGTSTPIPRPNALRYFERKGGYTEAQFIGSMGSVPDDWGQGAQAPWMRNFVSLCLNHAVELGYTPAKPLADWVTFQTLAVASGPEPRHIADYVVPDIKSNGGYYQTLADMYDGWPHNADGSQPSSMPPNSASGFSASGAPNTLGVTVEGYGAIAAAAIAMANAAPDQHNAWSVVKPWSQNTAYFHHDPRYAILPRG